MGHKTCRRTNVDTQINTKGNRPIAFTIDPLGGLGPFATSFLFQPIPTPTLTFLSSTAKAAHTLAAGPSRVTAILAHADSHWRKLILIATLVKHFAPQAQVCGKTTIGPQLCPCLCQVFCINLSKHTILLFPSSLVPLCTWPTFYILLLSNL